jgi:dTDP-4-amino-4,6-dideoxygalactose transaminase
VTNCTVGLHLACAALGLGPGDEVIVPSLTFVATSNAVLYTGATPIFADITGETDLTVSPASIESLITEHTRAIIIMHYGGYACDMHAIEAIATKHNLAIIEDAAHAVGSSLENRALGTWGNIGVYSFFSNKNLTTGEGGMVVTDDDALASSLRLKRSHGMTSLTWDRHRGHAWSYDVVDIGYNYRIDEIRAAMGSVQLKKLPKNNSHRRELSGLYRSLLQEAAPTIVVPFADHPGLSACHIFPILLPDPESRPQFMEMMKAKGIQTSIHYPPIHTFSYYRNKVGSQVSLPVTENIASREVTLPLYPGMSNEDVKQVVMAVHEAILSL